MESEKQKIIVSGKGNSKKEAFAEALSKIQTEVLKNTEDVILQIEPVNVKVLQAEECQWTERFLFFFFPRQRREFHLTLEVEVSCTRIIDNEIEFTLKKENPEGIRIPLINKSI